MFRKTEQAKEESRLGYRYSVLLNLPYFRPIEMLPIDPMHNLFLGTAKHFARDLWIGRNILTHEALSIIEVRLKNTIVPTGLGRLPVSIKTGTFITAEQWKNWTIHRLNAGENLFSLVGDSLSIPLLLMI